MQNSIIIAPNSKGSEMMVLGCMLTNADHLQKAVESLIESDFYFSEHKIIFRALKKSHKNGKGADIHLICEDLKAHDALNDVGGAQYIVSLVQYVGTSAYMEEYIDEVKNKSVSREILHISKETEKAVLEGRKSSAHLIEEVGSKLKSLESRQDRKIPLITTEERLKKEDEFLTKHRGQKYIGLRVKTIEEFNENFLGLRGLVLLAAAPNVGKTALTVQTAIEVLSTEKDACLVYISLEMSEEQIFRRMILNLSGLDFRTFVFGSQSQQQNSDRQVFFKIEEINGINEAENILKSFGNRLQILDLSACPHLDVKTVINFVQALKKKSKCSRAIVIIDYLQVWPISTDVRFFSENESDKWRIGEMKKIRDAMSDDPVIVISEARKPSGKDELWGGDLSDVMGSARGTYTPDVVMLLSQLKPKSLSAIWEKNNLPTLKIEEDIECATNDKEGMVIKNFLAKYGIAICKLEVPKARDGMQKFSILLEFHFHKNVFQKVNLEGIRKISQSRQLCSNMFRK